MHGSGELRHYLFSDVFLARVPFGYSRFVPPMMDLYHPYSALTPDCALDALDSTGLKADGRLLALNSYENRSTRWGLKMRRCRRQILSYPNAGRPAILEEHAYTIELAAREIPVSRRWL